MADGGSIQGGLAPNASTKAMIGYGHCLGISPLIQLALRSDRPLLTMPSSQGAGIRECRAPIR
jgi:hypothetical protein